MKTMGIVYVDNRDRPFSVSDPVLSFVSAVSDHETSYGFITVYHTLVGDMGPQDVMALVSMPDLAGGEL